MIDNGDEIKNNNYYCVCHPLKIKLYDIVFKEASTNYVQKVKCKLNQCNSVYVATKLVQILSAKCWNEKWFLN